MKKLSHASCPPLSLCVLVCSVDDLSNEDLAVLLSEQVAKSLYNLWVKTLKVNTTISPPPSPHTRTP